MAGCDRDVASQEKQPNQEKGWKKCMHFLRWTFLYPCRFQGLIHESVHIMPRERKCDSTLLVQLSLSFYTVVRYGMFH